MKGGTYNIQECLIVGGHCEVMFEDLTQDYLVSLYMHRGMLWAKVDATLRTSKHMIEKVGSLSELSELHLP